MQTSFGCSHYGFLEDLTFYKIAKFCIKMVGFGFRGHIVDLVSQEFCGDRTSLVWLVWSKQDSNVCQFLSILSHLTQV